ncbi:MAG: hypothetical protein M0033_10865 [Nitrospiraceae bacterium]|nr:hypothetical protein [Nitrospiraceae bacterium]
MLVQDMFWGDRVGTVQDPFGYSWSLATHKKDVTQQELQEGAKTMFAQMARKQKMSRVGRRGPVLIHLAAARSIRNHMKDHVLIDRECLRRGTP